MRAELLPPPSRRKKKKLGLNREERSLRHVTMVAKFLDYNKPKTSLKKSIRTVSNFINLTQFHLICKILAKLSEDERESTLSALEKENFVLCPCTNSIKRAREIRKFHVADLQQRLRNAQKA